MKIFRLKKTKKQEEEITQQKPVMKTLNSPCCIKENSIKIIERPDKEITLNFIYSSKKNLYQSIFINVKEIVNLHSNISKSLLTSDTNSFEIHFTCIPGVNKQITFNIPQNQINLQKLFEKNQQLDKYDMIIRQEPVDNSFHFVNMFYFMIEKIQGEFHFKYLQHKMEVKDFCYKILNIHGMNQNEGIDSEAFQEMCTLCYSNKVEIINLPCRHMCLCYECALKYNQKDENLITKLKRECTICRIRLKGFLKINFGNQLN